MFVLYLNILVILNKCVFTYQERKLELSKLQPISENAWLKRSNSDPSLTQVGDITSFFCFSNIQKYLLYYKCVKITLLIKVEF